ncbi:MAG: RDD family protein [Gammaproteobacteria bacterium]|nr:RDD family protein [Gammaproteobacteria bacterium]
MNDAARKSGLGRRLVAAAIDFVIVGVAGLVLVITTGASEDAEDYAGNIPARIVAFGFLTYFLVNGLPLWRRSQTVGKALLGLVVVAAGTQTQAPLWRLVARAPFFMALYGVFLGWPGLIALVDQGFIFGAKRRCLHDLICGTEVVRRDELRMTA